MKVAFKQIVVNPGQQILIKELTWSEFEEILEDLGEKRSARVSYSNGILEIVVPLPEHEKNKEIIGELVRILLDKLESDFEVLGSTTFKNQLMNQAVEADTCFYIQNHQAVIGKDRLDLTIDPAPDLAIEIDITSRTYFDNYRLLKVPELWRYTKKGLQINLLQEDRYIQSKTSPNFPNIPIIELVDRYVQQSQIERRSKAIRAFKAWIQENID